jgi:hypothetical protein
VRVDGGRVLGLRGDGRRLRAGLVPGLVLGLVLGLLLALGFGSELLLGHRDNGLSLVNDLVLGLGSRHHGRGLRLNDLVDRRAVALDRRLGLLGRDLLVLVLVFMLGGGVGALAAQHDSAAGRLGRRGLGGLLALELLDHRLGLVILERRGVALDVVFVSVQPLDHLLVGEAEILRKLVDALLRHPV